MRPSANYAQAFAVPLSLHSPTPFLAVTSTLLAASPTHLCRLPHRPRTPASPPRYALLCSARPLTAIVIGGGPSGFFTAITLARASAHLSPAPSVTILESSATTLHKVRISGGGRCNCTNAAPAPSFALGYPSGRGRREMLSPLAAFSAEDMRRWLEDEGVALKVEATGKVFPVSNDSGSVVKALEDAARKAGVKVEMGVRVRGVGVEEDDFGVEVKGGGVRKADVVVIATGGSREGLRWAEALGHEVVDPLPSLFTFRVRDKRLEGLAGLAVADADVRLDFPPPQASSTEASSPKKKRRRPGGGGGPPPSQRGPVLVTHWGLSGPAVIQASSDHARDLAQSSYIANCVVNWAPSLTRSELREALEFGRARLAAKDVATVCPLREDAALPVRLWRRLAESAGVETGVKWASVGKEGMEGLAVAVERSVFEVRGKGEFKEEFVTAGGVSTGKRGVSTKTYESRLVPNLFVVGEATNIDGRTGGFNFQSCWSGGFVAGTAIAQRFEELGYASAEVRALAVEER